MNGCSRAASTSWPEAPPDYVNVTTPDPAGTTATVALNVYDGTGEGIPLTARYLEGMDASATASSEGAAVCFTFAARSNALDQALVHVLLPAGARAVAAQEPLVTGPDGLMENDGWTVIGRSTPASYRPAEGARDEMSFQPGDSLLVQPDCNRGHGAWQVSPPGGLTFAYRGGAHGARSPCRHRESAASPRRRHCPAASRGARRCAGSRPAHRRERSRTARRRSSTRSRARTAPRTPAAARDHAPE